ncbi:hypothetical protein [Nostoc sp. DSM 114159]
MIQFWILDFRFLVQSLRVQQSLMGETTPDAPLGETPDARGLALSEAMPKALRYAIALGVSPSPKGRG